jgi:hypothetical protein
MKKFIVMILCVATFFIGLGGLIEGVGAKFKSDERALELLRQARQAVGGDQSIAAVRSMTITGRVTKTFDFDGAAKTEQGDWELNLQMPDKFSKTMKLRREGGNGDGKTENIDKEVIVVRQSGELKEKIALPEGEGGDKKRVAFIVKNDGGEKTIASGDGDKVQDRRIILYKDGKDGGADFRAFHHNELFRTTLALLLTPPQGVDVSYKYAGDGSVDGANCDIVEATANGTTIRLYLDKTSHLPAMMSYQAPKPFIIKIKKEEGKTSPNEDVKILRDNLRDKIPAPEMAEYQVKFSDFRNVGGIQLPHRWTQTIGGKDDETIDITGYELNPANIVEKFKEGQNRVFVRTAKPQ